MYHHICVTGHPDGWNVAFYMLRFTSITVLVGTGWSYMRPFPVDNAKRVLIVMLPLQGWPCEPQLSTHFPAPPVPDRIHSAELHTAAPLRQQSSRYRYGKVHCINASQMVRW